MALQGAASDYYNMPGGVNHVGGIFGDLSPGPAPFLGGSAAAANQYQTGIVGQQNALLALQHNALAEPVAAPQANYGAANTLAAQGNSAYGMAQGGMLNAAGAIQGAQGAYQGAQGQLGQQVQATGLAQQAALGNVPSQAALQQSAGIGQAVRSQLSAAASTRGGAAQQAAAGQQAAMQGAQMQSQGINQAAQLRAQEMATARGQYLGSTQANTAAAQAQTQAAQAQTQAQQQMVGLGYQGAGLSLQQQAQAASQAQFQAQQQLQQNQVNNALAGTYGQEALGYGQLGLSGMQSQLGADTASQQQLTQAKQAANSSDTNFATGIIGAAGGVLGALSDVRSKQSIQPAAGGQPAQAMAQPIAPNAGNVVGNPQLAQPQAPPVSGMTKDQAMAFLRGDAMPTQPMAAPQPMVQPGAMSDKDTKAGAKPAEHVADEYLDHLAKSAATYSYKDPAQAPAQRPAGAKFGGVMAQDLETVPEIGHQLVSDTPQGKTLEGGSNLTAALMGLGRLHERLKALEESRASK